MQFFFSGNATDTIGNTGPLISPVNITVDIENPVLMLNITDNFGRNVSSGVAEMDATGINIGYYAYDAVSGINDSTLYYTVRRFGAIDSYVASCGSSAPGGWINCTENIAYDSDTVISYYVEGHDRAGNSFRFPSGSVSGIITSHPLFSLGLSYMYISVGESRLLPLYTMNILDVPDNVTMEIDGYPYAKFDTRCTPDTCTLSADKRSITILNLNPYEQRLVHVRIGSTQPNTYSVQINATSEVEPSNVDSNTFTIDIGYPVYFPGLGEWGILMIIILSLAYVAMSGDIRYRGS